MKAAGFRPHVKTIRFSEALRFRSVFERSVFCEKRKVFRLYKSLLHGFGKELTDDDPLFFRTPGETFE